MTREFAQVPGLHLENWLPAISLAKSFKQRNPLALNPETPAAPPHTL